MNPTKTGRHDVAELLLKVALSTKKIKIISVVCICPRLFIVHVVKIEILTNIIFNVCKSTIKSYDILIFNLLLSFIFLGIQLACVLQSHQTPEEIS